MNYPKISCLIPVYLRDETQEYLNLCLNSIENSNYPKEKLEVIVESSGEHVPQIDYKFIEKIKTRHTHTAQRRHFASAVNAAADKADGELYLILSDDCVLTKNALHQLAMGSKMGRVIQAAMSNCDNGILYHADLGNVPRQFRLDQIRGQEELFMSAQIYAPANLFFTTHLFFYSVLIPRDVWDLVGPLDEKFKSGQEDIDYSLRARDKGIKLAINSGALIWHFSGVTADETMTRPIREENIEYFKEKWGFNPIIGI